MIWQLTFDRASLPGSLAPLVIGTDPFAGAYHLPEDGLDRPNFTIRRSYAPDSDWVSGRQLLAAVTDAGSLPVVIYTHGADAAALETAVVALEAAASQFDYDLTITVDGQARVFAADPELPQWTQDPGMVAAHMARASWVIPLNPI